MSQYGIVKNQHHFKNVQEVVSHNQRFKVSSTQYLFKLRSKVEVIPRHKNSLRIVLGRRNGKNRQPEERTMFDQRHAERFVPIIPELPDRQHLPTLTGKARSVKATCSRRKRRSLRLEDSYGSGTNL
jgi:hypothetical protein